MSDNVVSFKDFSYKYSDGTLALSDITFDIKKGESVGIIGHNGSGKSTLFMNIVGILEPGGGIEVCGYPVDKKNLAHIRSIVGFVFDDPRDQLFMSRVIEDVAFGPLNMGFSREDAYEKAEKALSMVGLHGFDNRISYHLSGGEMQRAAIATVLSMSPEIIVMDEPSSGLDPRSKRDLISVIRSLNCTKLFSSHDLEFVRTCADRVILLEKGRIIADGPCKEILANTEFLIEHGL